MGLIYRVAIGALHEDRQDSTCTQHPSPGRIMEDIIYKLPAVADDRFSVIVNDKR